MRDWRLAGPATGDSRATWYPPALYARRSGVATKRTTDAVSVLAARRDNRDAVNARPSAAPHHRAEGGDCARCPHAGRRPKVVRIDWRRPAPAGALSRPASLVVLDL